MQNQLLKKTKLLTTDNSFYLTTNPAVTYHEGNVPYRIVGKGSNHLGLHILQIIISAAIQTSKQTPYGNGEENVTKSSSQPLPGRGGTFGMGGPHFAEQHLHRTVS